MTPRGAVSTAPPVRAAVAADFRASNWGRRLALIGVLFWLAYEWGIGNETVTPLLLANVITNTDGFAAVPAAAAVGFAFTALQQLGAGLTALFGFSMFDRTSHAAWTRLNERFHRVPGEWSTLGWGGRSVLVFGLGTTAVALVQIMATGHAGVRRHQKVVVESALLCGLLVGVIAGAVAALAAAGREIDALDGPTEWVLRVLGNPLFWLGVLILGGAVHVARAHRHPHLPGTEQFEKNSNHAL